MWRALEQLSQQVAELTPQAANKRKRGEEEDVDTTDDTGGDNPHNKRKRDSTPAAGGRQGKRFTNRAAGLVDHDAVRAFMTDVSVSVRA